VTDASPEQPPAAPDEPVTTVHEPTTAAPPVAPVFEAPRAPVPPPPTGGGIAEEKPEVLVAGAFAGGALFALILKRFGRR